ncbi:MAG: spore maturation protein [Elusimicrobia bacterium]|nr:spore maturation protein [Candidatus Liberimonas magnetica]
MEIINYFSLILVPAFVLFILTYGIFKKVNIYASFVSGAKDGLGIVAGIFPYILAIFVAIKVFQSSGAFDALKNILAYCLSFLGVPAEVIAAGLLKPLSSSASLGVFIETIKSAGVDSAATMMVAVIIGSAETTFYVLAVYLGAVGIKNSKFLVPVCIISDIIGIFVAILTVKLIF